MNEWDYYDLNSLFRNNISVCLSSLVYFKILLEDSILILIVFVPSESGNIATYKLFNKYLLDRFILLNIDLLGDIFKTIGDYNGTLYLSYYI